MRGCESCEHFQNSTAGLERSRRDPIRENLAENISLFTVTGVTGAESPEKPPFAKINSTFATKNGKSLDWHIRRHLTTS